ncbi:MbtH family NRPS accessory protein [Yersinia massiliensis]|uniref:MbtH family NRPS accessory protein n=1 Tax=Yersinia massiliensis TaxID=419257 RepID=A0A2R4NMW0_9GAMM|nr:MULTISPECIES: MbtH family NRPS accessory protein [Yersinia]HEC1649768.1 MbtH family NRPS accessory protein [Yersinia enterocolitica]AVX37470.1 MbtH family protein [Yersinia massiliensis]MDA5546351.1 MbtH family NRPS accessory protein [Yersinia massiliensis]NIL27179.1 MbtH family NRPS accessory protein [Yersinia massiliensis]OWF75129.1 MbtH family protein [Yersinia frederiksenii]
MSNETQVNPFDNEELPFLVLINAQQQYSLWPQITAIPAGWTSVYGPQSRADCVKYLEANWTDMRPASLIRAEAALR